MYKTIIFLLSIIMNVELIYSLKKCEISDADNNNNIECTHFSTIKQLAQRIQSNWTSLTVTNLHETEVNIFYHKILFYIHTLKIYVQLITNIVIYIFIRLKIYSSLL